MTAEKIANEVEDLGFGAQLIKVYQIGGNEDGKDGEEGAEVEDIRESNFVIRGMTCANCKNGIEKLFLEGNEGGPLKGIFEFSISLMTHQARVKYDISKIKPRAIVDEIESLGFEADIL